MNEATAVYLALGSNVGDRAGLLRQAKEALGRDGVIILHESPVYETEPLYPEDGAEWFLNQAVMAETALSPRELLTRIQAIEATLGRVRSRAHAGPRTIDIDILLFGDQTIRSPELTIPHPRMRDRRCVLAPLADIHPGYRRALSECADTSKVKPL